MTQHDRILNYIDAHGSITAMEAFAELGITKLATRISELSRLGVMFTKVNVESENRYGEKVRFVRYSRKA